MASRKTRAFCLRAVFTDSLQKTMQCDCSTIQFRGLWLRVGVRGVVRVEIRVRLRVGVGLVRGFLGSGYIWG